uniref:Uncharacterized protein n=1 Tax=Rhizophora mucronata TaxID=61149 RepID=A0A2P2P6D6_RHIMU
MVRYYTSFQSLSRCRNTIF